MIPDLKYLLDSVTHNSKLEKMKSCTNHNSKENQLLHAALGQMDKVLIQEHNG